MQRLTVRSIARRGSFIIIYLKKNNISSIIYLKQIFCFVATNIDFLFRTTMYLPPNCQGECEKDRDVVDGDCEVDVEEHEDRPEQ